MFHTLDSNRFSEACVFFLWHPVCRIASYNDTASFIWNQLHPALLWRNLIHFIDCSDGCLDPKYGMSQVNRNLLQLFLKSSLYKLIYWDENNLPCMYGGLI